MRDLAGQIGDRLKGFSFDYLILALGALMILPSYVCYLYNIEWLLNSDMATEILNGREMYLRKTIFLSQWFHSSEIFLIRNPMFVAMWLFATDSLLGAYILAVITEIILMIVCFAYMGKRLGLSGQATLVGILVFFGTRTYMTGNYSGMTTSAYATVYMLCFLVFGYYAARTKGNSNVSDKIVGFLIPLLAFVFGISSMRMLTILFFPVMFVHLVKKLWSKKLLSFKNDSLSYELILWVLLSVAGILITSNILRPLGFGPFGYNSKSTLGILYAMDVLLPTLITDMFHYDPIFPFMIENNVLSLPVINGILSFLFYLLMVYMIWLTWTKDIIIRLTTYKFILTSLGLVVLIQLTIYVKAYIQIRYYLLIFVFLALVFAYGAEDLSKNNNLLKRGIYCFLAIFFATNSFSNIAMLPEIKETNISRVSNWNAQEISDILQKHGIDLAYALYWDSNTITVLTNGKTEVAAVLGNFTPMPYVTPYRYFSPDLADTKTAFIRIDQPVFEKFKNLLQFKITDNGILDKAVVIESVKGTFYNIDIYIFDQNYFTFPKGHNMQQEYVPLTHDLRDVDDVFKY